jgi:hypothetical protein
VRLEGLGQLKKIHLIGIRTRDLAACSIVPQPTTLPRANGQFPAIAMVIYNDAYMASCNPSDVAASVSSIYSFTDSWSYSGICQFELCDMWHYGT